MKPTIYRACKCGETAHDAKARLRVDGTWEHYYACRNCKKERVVKKRTPPSQASS